MKRFAHIVYVVDGSFPAPSASLITAAALAKNHHARLTLLVVNQVPSFSTEVQHLYQQALQQQSDELEKLANSLNLSDSVSVSIRTGKKYVEVIHAVRELHCDLVIKECEDAAWLQHLFGSDDMHLLRKCPIPVWLMKPNQVPKYRNVVAAIDLESDSLEPNQKDKQLLNQKILEIAASISLIDNANLHVINAYDVPQAGFIGLWVGESDKNEQQLYENERRAKRYALDSCLARFQQKVGEETYQYLNPRLHLVQGSAAHEIPKFAQSVNADLVVMGTLARSGIAGVLIGNTAENILYQLNCAVVTLKPEGFVSPILAPSKS
ncbi:universal stress protein [Vibrio cholerae]|nr:universal stress protein [Vibrio cholerae]